MNPICAGCKRHMDIAPEGHGRVVILKREGRRAKYIVGTEWQCPECNGCFISFGPSVSPEWTHDLRRLEKAFEIGKHEE